MTTGYEETRQRAREKLLFKYSSALQRGDFDAVARVLREAERDSALNQMIAEVDDIHRAEMESVLKMQSAVQLPSVVQTNHHKAIPKEKESVMFPTLTMEQRTWKTTSPALAAAILALALFAGVLFMARIGFDGPKSGTSGAAINGSQGTTQTPSPAGQIATGCQFTTATALRLEVRTEPNGTRGIAVDIPAGTVLQINNHAPAADNAIWYFITAQVEMIVVQGWVNAASLPQVVDCEPSLPTPTMAPSSIHTATPAFMPTPTLVPAQSIAITPTFTIAEVVTICQVNTRQITRLEVRPEMNNGTVVTVEIPAGSTLFIHSQATAPDGSAWYLILAQINQVMIYGWIRADSVADQVNCIVAPTISVGTLPPLPVIPAPILATVVPIPYEITVVPTVVPPKP